MTNYLFYDTETSGFISDSKTHDDPTQAFAVQLGALLCDEEGNTLNEVCKIIKPNGRFIHPATIEIHGITPEYAEEHGVDEVEVLECYALLLDSEPLRVCHNATFDEKFLDHMFKRNMEKLSDYGRSRYFLEKNTFCTMQNKTIKAWCNLKNVRGYIKPPKLSELYKLLFEEDILDEHDALADAKATKRCFFELQKKGIIP